MANQKVYRVVSKPVKYEPKLPGFAPNPDLPVGQKPSVLKRSAVRVYELAADSPAEAKSIIEARERDLTDAGLQEYRVSGNAKAI